MRTIRLATVLCVFALSGCVALPSNRPVVTLVRDAETKQPILGANVAITYEMSHTMFEPRASSAVTRPDGRVRLLATPTADAMICLETKAPKYLTEEKDLSTEEIEKIAPAGFFEDVGKRKPALIVEMYAEPRPQIGLILPNGFKGIFKVDVQVKDDKSLANGQRAFTVRVDANGVATLVGSPLLRHLQSNDYAASYENGAVIPRSPKDSAVGLWWAGKEGQGERFFVGAESEYTAMRNAEKKDSRDSSRSSPGGGKRGGGGRRRGG